VHAHLSLLLSISSPTSHVQSAIEANTPQRLEITYKEHSIAQVQEMTVAQARNFFDEGPVIHRVLDIVRDVGTGYLRLWQSVTERFR